MKPEKDIDFNLDSSLAVGTAVQMERLRFLKCLFSISEIWFYLLIAVAMLVLVAVLKIF